MSVTEKDFIDIDGLRIRVRPMRPTDRNFVLSTWVRSAAVFRYGGQTEVTRVSDPRNPRGFRYEPRQRWEFESIFRANEWADATARLVEVCVAHDDFYIACADNNEDVIVGWASSRYGVPQYVYVSFNEKLPARRKGVGRMLLNAIGESRHEAIAS